jgi:uncharacterized protein YbjT (DUF2867 family)
MESVRKDDRYRSGSSTRLRYEGIRIAMLPAVFVTGGTGYIGRPLIGALSERGCVVHALMRRESQSKLPAVATAVIGNALDAATFASAIPRGATIVHLVGTPHPSPSKAAEFEAIDLASIRATTTAATLAGARHLIYISVAHPAPVMEAYIAARVRGEALVGSTGIPATILRPWYVLGPGHWWPYALVPIYALLRALPATRAGAERLGLLTLGEMVDALVHVVVAPPPSRVRILGVPDIRRAALRGLS